MAAKNLPDQAYLRECLDYDPETGVLTWRRRPREHFPSEHEYKRWHTRFFGHRAGSVSHSGYRDVLVGNRNFREHRIIFKWMTGKDPTGVIDHRNCCKDDNRWGNLRDASLAQSNHNKPYKNGPLPKGVSKSWSRWKAMIWVSGNEIYLGTFDTPDAAHEAYCAAAKGFYGEFFDPGVRGFSDKT